MSDSNDGDDNRRYDEEVESSGIFDKTQIGPGRKNMDIKNSQYPERRDLTNEEMIARRIDSYLVATEICNIRANVRNSMRSIFERYGWLAKFRGEKKIDTVNAQYTADEQRYYHARKVRILMAEEADVHPVKALHVSEGLYTYLDTYRDDDKIAREEFAKYIGEKLKYIFEAGDYKKARAFVDVARAKIKMPLEMNALNEIVGYKVVDAFSEAVKVADPKKVIVAFYELGAIHRFRSFELLDLSVSLRTKPEIKKVFLQELGMLMAADAVKYKLVKDYLVELEFLGRSEAVVSEQVLEGMNKSLRTALEVHPVAYHQVKKRLTRMNLPVELCEKAHGAAEVEILRWLAVEIRHCGFQYALVRDYWAEMGMVDADSCDINPKIVEASKGAFRRMYELHPIVYKILRTRWAQLGITEPFDSEYLRSINFGAWNGSGTKVDPSAMGDFVKETIDEEKQKAEQNLETEVGIQDELLREMNKDLNNKRRLFLKNYPQFRKKNRPALKKREEDRDLG
jgi:hypothetical protein